MANDVKWIKIVTNIFDDEKVLMIESLPSADSILVVWFKLLCLAGKTNNSGVFMFNERFPYTDEMLASIFRRDINIVRLALKTFEDFGMIEIIDNVITIPNWGKHQSLDAYEKKKLRDRERVAAKRAEQRALIAQSPDVSRDKSPDKSPVVASLDIDKEKEEDKDKEFTVSKDTVCGTDVQRIIQAWNGLGLSQVSKIVRGTKRSDMLNKRIKDYGTESILQAIAKIPQSDFLMGNGKDGWIITFDWFIRPNNFPKVLGGNYDKNQPPKSTGGRKEMVPSWMNKDREQAFDASVKKDMEWLKQFSEQQKTVENDAELKARADALRRKIAGEEPNNGAS